MNIAVHTGRPIPRRIPPFPHWEDDFSDASGRKERKAKRKQERKDRKHERKIEKKQSKARYVRSVGKRDERQAKGEATAVLAQQGIVSPHLAEASGKEKFMKGLTSTLGGVAGIFGGGPAAAAPEASYPADAYATMAAEYVPEPEPAYDPAYNEVAEPVTAAAQRMVQDAYTMEQPDGRPATDPAAPADQASKTRRKWLIIGAAALAAVVVAFIVMRKRK